MNKKVRALIHKLPCVIIKSPQTECIDTKIKQATKIFTEFQCLENNKLKRRDQQRILDVVRRECGLLIDLTRRQSRPILFRVRCFDCPHFYEITIENNGSISRGDYFIYLVERFIKIPITKRIRGLS